MLEFSRLLAPIVSCTKWLKTVPLLHASLVKPVLQCLKPLPGTAFGQWRPQENRMTFGKRKLSRSQCCGSLHTVAPIWWLLLLTRGESQSCSCLSSCQLFSFSGGQVCVTLLGRGTSFPCSSLMVSRLEVARDRWG